MWPMTQPPAPASGRRLQLVEAAVSVVARAGLRGLTHRAVDAEAGLPEGTCSGYLRTRNALLTALMQHVGATLATDVDALSARLARRPGDDAYAAEQTVALFASWLDRPELMVVRSELTLEAMRHPVLLEAFLPWRDRLLAVVEAVVAGYGHDEPRVRAETVLASLEGVLTLALLRPPAQRRRYVRDTVRIIVSALSEFEAPAPPPGAEPPADR